MIKYALAFLLAAVPAFAHMSPTGQYYDAYCCNSGDCAVVPASSVVAGADGWIVTLNPGDHFLVTQTMTYVKPYGEERQSTDGNFHACLWPTPEKLHCLYVPPMGF